MAKAVSYSLYYFCRAFNAITHHTPYDYLMRRRLTESASELLATDRRIIDIGLDYQFNSPELFSRAFKRFFGRPPQQWRKKAQLDGRWQLSRLTSSHLVHRNGDDFCPPIMVEKPTIQVMGIMTVVKDEETAVTQLWDLLTNMLPEETAVARYGLRYYPKDWMTRGTLYMSAVESEEDVPADSPFVTRQVPEGAYAQFVHTGARKKLPLTRDYIYQTWLPKSGQQLAYPWKSSVLA